MSKRKKMVVVFIFVLLISVSIFAYLVISMKQENRKTDSEIEREEKEITDLDSFYYQNVTKKHQDIRELPEEYTKLQAQGDNCFIDRGHDSINLYHEFMNHYDRKETAFIRVIQSTVEGDTIIMDVLYDSKKNKVYLVKDNTRDKFSAEEDRNILLKIYEKTGVWEYQGEDYWVVYNGELPEGKTAEYTINADELFIITAID